MNKEEMSEVIADALAPDAWDTEALRRDFEVHSFLAPFVVVSRKADGVKGTLEFTHSPRLYFNFVPDRKP